MLASVITVVALPFLWNARQSGGNESVAALGAGGGVAASTAATGGLTAPTELISPSYLVDPLAPAVSTVPGVVVIDVASPSDGKSATGVATYIRWSGSNEDRPCGTTLAPFGARVVVTNSNNGYKVACKNVSSKPLAEGVVIVLDAEELLQIADLTDAPVPVTITW